MKAIFLILLFGSPLSTPQPLASDPRLQIENEEYAVYESLIALKARNEREPAVVVVNRTSSNAIGELTLIRNQPDLSIRLATVDERLQHLSEKLNGISLETLKDLLTKDTRADSFRTNFQRRGKYTLMSRDRVNKLFERWQGLWKYPGTSGVLTFSRVGFNTRKTEALVYVGFECGRHCCSSSRFTFLKKTRTGWMFKSDYVTFIT